MPLAADHLIACRLALAHLVERPDIGCRVRAVKDDGVEAAEAQAEGGKLGLRLLGELESVRPVVVPNSWQLAKQDLVADHSGGRGGRRRRCVGERRS